MLDEVCWQHEKLSGRNRAETARDGAKRFYRGRISFSTERIVSLQAPRPKDSSLLSGAWSGSGEGEKVLPFTGLSFFVELAHWDIIWRHYSLC